MPCNVIPEEILTDHPDRYRAMIVESANPAHSLADTPAWRQALAKLDLVVTIDVAMTETARHSDYVLPTATQYEKWECSFFNLEPGENTFQLRKPIMSAPDGVLGEPEIHARLCEALGAVPQDLVDSLNVTLREHGGEWTQQFIGGLPDGPVPFHYPAPAYVDDLLQPESAAPGETHA